MSIGRSAGILLHVTSLPGPFGVGTFGIAACRFAESLARAGIRYWQVLPLGHPEASDSPYQCYSAFAGNPILIDPDELAATGLVTAKEAAACRIEADPRMVSYGEAAVRRASLLRAACSRLDRETRAEVDAFSGEQSGWLPDYALFMAIRERFDGLPWWKWPDEGLRRHEPAALESFAAQHAEACLYHRFLQYEFYRQWDSLKKKTNGLGVLLFGDMPIYVARNSADVWSHTALFEMDDRLEPRRVAGVPPDYFSADGQLWGNPLYDWNAGARDGYAWWLSRIGHALRQFDAVRIDHFRGFEAYWAVDAEEETARNGNWVDGPGMALFGRVAALFREARIVAEDLGLLTDRTRAFLQETGYPGMRVMQFGFDGNPRNEHLPHMYPHNCVAYIGTHDNDTLTGWLEREDPDAVRLSARYCRAPEGSADRVCMAWIQTLWASVADLAVATPQDLLALDGTRRMNVPGTASDNWTFRLTQEETDAIPWDLVRELNTLYGRL